MGLAFGVFRIDSKAYRLLRDGDEVPLERRAFDMLVYLIEHEDRVVSKEELMAKVWAANALTDSVITNTVAKLRRALGQGRSEHGPIQTIHGRGYRFRAPVSAADSEGASEPVRSDSEPFVGRGALMQALQPRFLHRPGGSENVVALLGEGGIGKTRVCRELAALAQRSGTAVWWGCAHETPGAPPYWPWVQVLREARAELGEPEWTSSIPQGAVVIHHALGVQAATALAPALEPIVARFRLFDEVSTLLRRVAMKRAILIVLDDLHCADSGTLELLAHASRALQGCPIAFLVTARSGEPNTDADNVRAFQQVARHASVNRLQGLVREEVADLVHALRGRALSDEELSALHMRTRGNPLFIKHALELISQGQPFSSSHEDGSPGAIPEALRQILERRLLGLPAETRQLLSTAAVMGKDCDTSLLAEVTGLSVTAVLEGLAPAVRCEIIEINTANADALSFAHVLVVECLYDQLTPRERGTIHGRVAHTLARCAQHERSRKWSEAAHHFLRAVPFDAREGAKACRKAASIAEQSSDLAAAATILRRTIDRLDTRESATEASALRTRLLIELGAVQFYAGLLTTAWGTFRDAADAAQEYDDTEALSAVAPRLADCVEVGVGELLYARAVVERLLSRQDRLTRADRATLLAQLAELSPERSADERSALLDKARERAEECRVPDAILDVAHTRAIQRDPARLHDNERAAARFLELAACHPEAEGRMRARSLRYFGVHLTRYLCALTACDLQRADVALETCADIAATSHSTVAQYAVTLMRAGRAHGDGRLEVLATLLQSLKAAGLEVTSRLANNYYKAMLLEATGRMDQIPLDGPVFTRTTSSRHDLYRRIFQARALAVRGAHQRARAMIGQLPAVVLSRMPARLPDLGVLCLLAETYALTGDTANVDVLYDCLLPHAARNAVGVAYSYLGSVEHYLGLLARMRGDTATSSRHFARSIEMNRQLGMPSALARSESELRSEPRSRTTGSSARKGSQRGAAGGECEADADG